MHIFLYPEKDTYINNESSYKNKNFGIDEILELKSIPQLTRVLNNYTHISITGNYSQSFVNYSGSVIGNIYGGDSYALLYVSKSADFSASMFNGGLSGSYNGGPITLTNFSNASGHFSGTVTGSLTSSFTGSICYASGTLYKFNGSINGQLSGSADVYQPYYSYINNPDLSRILLKFDLSKISSSIITGDINTDDIKFYLKLKATQVDEIPLNYTVYAYPISQSWEMGIGRYATGGDSIGVSWNYRNESVTSGLYWYGTGSVSYYGTSSNYLIDSASASASFQNEGGTWFYSVPNTYTTPTSSIKTSFYNTASSTPTFESQYSSSLNTNLTSSFSSSLSDCLNSILTSCSDSSSVASENYSLLFNFASSSYYQTSQSVSSSLTSLYGTASVYNYAYTSSTAFLSCLSSSIQSVLESSASLVNYTNQRCQYISVLSSSISHSTIYSELYTAINNLVTASISSSVSASSLYNTYNNYYNSLVSSVSSDCLTFNSTECSCSSEYQSSSISSSLMNQSYIGYLSSSVSSSLLSTSLNVYQTSFSSSVLTYFSASLMSCINSKIDNIKESTRLQVSQSLIQKFAPKFCNLVTGSSLICSEQFNYETSDVNIDVTDIVKGWICGCVPNEGIILLSSLELSDADNVNGTIKFFSKESNTIYSPYLDIAYDDSEYITGNLVPLNTFNPYTVVVKNLNRTYKFGSVVRINVFAREKSPLKNFVKGYQQSQYLSSSLLPSETYFAIKDNNSENMIMDFDDYTKLSCDGSIHYFNLDTTTLPVERYYRLLIKTVIDGETKIFDNGNIFTITR